MGDVQMSNCSNIRMNNYEKYLRDCRFDIKRIAYLEFKISTIFIVNGNITLVIEITTLN